MNQINKQCSKCHQSKPIESFRKQSKSRDGLKSYCKECDNQIQRELYQKNRDKRIVQAIEYRRRKLKSTETS